MEILNLPMKKVIGGTLLVISLGLGVMGYKDTTFESEINLSTHWYWGAPDEYQQSRARRGQAYQDGLRSKGTIELAAASVLLTTGIVVIITDRSKA